MYTIEHIVHGLLVQHKRKYSKNYNCPGFKVSGPRSRRKCEKHAARWCCHVATPNRNMWRVNCLVAAWSDVHAIVNFSLCFA